MEIAIVNLTGGGLSGGYRKYLQRLVPLLRANAKVRALRTFVPPQAVNILGIKEPSCIGWPVNDHRHGFRWLKSEIRRLAPDVVFIPTARWLNCGGIPVVVMVRNMEPLVLPFGGNPWPEALRNLGRIYAAVKSCRRAERVIAVSEYVRDFICSKWGIQSRKVGAVYHGIEPPPPADFLTKPASMTECGEHERFLFTAGSIRPARGLEDVINALGYLSQNGFHHKLVIAGWVDPIMEGYKRRLEALAFKLGVESRIHWAGPLSAREMSWCYIHCDFFIMTSRAEACPNIALEAMSHGCGSVSARTAPMPEIFDNTALYYKPSNGEALADVIRSAISLDKDRRGDLSERAKARAADFSWEKCAELTVAELLKAVDAQKVSALRKTQ